MLKISKNVVSIYFVIMTLIFIFVLLVFYFFIYKPNNANASWFNDSYAYRQTISFLHDANIASPRRISISIDSANLIGSGKLQSDCDDLRFTDKNTGKKLRYQLTGSCNSAATTLDIEFNSIFNGTNTAYVYYGNPTALSESTNLSSITSIGSTSSTGYIVPGATTGIWGCLIGNATSSDNQYCSESANIETQTFSNFNFSIPSGATINGIIVRMEASSGDITSGDNILAQLSHNSGTQYTSDKSTPTLTSTDSTYSLGNTTDTWGRTWSDTEFTNTNFRIRLTASIDSASFPTGSKVLLSDRTYKNIEELTPGINIMSYDPQANQLVSNRLTSIQKYPKEGYYQINNQSKATNNELIYAKKTTADSFVWTRVDHLELGDTILYTDTSIVQPVPVTSLIYVHDPTDVYTISASNPFNNYWVDGFLYDPPVGNQVGVDMLEAEVHYTDGPTATVTNEEESVSPVLYWSLDQGYSSSIQDSSQRGNNGTITGAIWQMDEMCVSGKCIYFDGSNDVVSSSSTITNVKTISFWVRPVTTSEQLVELNGTTNITLSNGTITTTNITSPTIYVNGNISSQLQANRWQHIVVTTSTGISASALKLGQISTNYGQIFIDEFQLYSAQLSSDQVKANFNSRGGSLTGTQTGQQSQLALSDGLVGHWKMDELTWNNNCTTTTVIDSSGNNQHSKSCPSTTGPTTSGIGRFGKGATFDGVDDYFLVDNASNLIANSDGFSLGGWVYPANNPTDNKGFFGIRNDTNGDFYVTQLSGSNTLECRYRNSTGVSFDTSNTVVPNTWNHVFISFDSNNLNCYVNGKPGTQSIADGSITNTSLGLLIGKSILSNSEINGRIDDVRLFNKGLIQAEVNQLYQWSPGPIGYWKMDEKSATTIYDSSGNNFLGTLSGSPPWIIGKYGSGLGFNGSSQYATISDNSILQPGLSDWTVSLWARPPNSDQNSIILGKYQPIGPNEQWSFNICGDISCSTNGQLLQASYVQDGSNARSAITSLDVADGNWHYFTFVADSQSDQIQLYVDGVDVSQSNNAIGSWPNINNTDNMSIGRSDDGTYYYSGDLDDIKIYNYSRSSTQIIEDMNANHPLVGTPIAGPVAHYRFDQGYGTTAQDSTQNNNDLTLSASSIWNNSGRIYRSLLFDGANRATRSDDSEFDFSASDPFTISMWFRTASSSNPGSSEFLLSKETGGSPGYAIYFTSNGRLNFGIDDDSTWNPDSLISPTTDYYDNQWHHLIAVKNGSTDAKLYLDGALIGETTVPAGSLENTDSLTIGDRNTSDDGNEFNGYIDELKIYRAAFSTDDVSTEYNQGKSLVLGSLSTETDGILRSNASSREHCVPGDTGTCNIPVGDWNLNENTGNTAYDTSSNGFNLSLSGTPTWRQGKFSSGLFFNNTANTYYSFDDTGSSLLDIAGSYSMSAWVKFVSTAIDYQTLIFKHIGSTGVFDENYFLGTDISPNRDEFICEHAYASNTFHNTPTTDVNIATNRWYYVTCVYDTVANTQRVYVDGILRATNSSATNDPLTSISGNSTGDLYIGGANSAIIFATSTLAGTLDQIKIFDFALSPAQIQWIFNKGNAVAWWKFDESSGTTAYDSSQNGNGESNGSTGTLTNTPTRISGGKLNGAIDFDGSDDVTSVTNNFRIDLNDALSQSLTYSFWAYPHSDGETDIGRIFEKTSTTYCRTTNDDGTNVDLECSLDLSTDATLNISDGLRLNQWSHVILTWSDDADDEITIFINGKNMGNSTNGVGPTGTDTSDLLIGGPTTANFDGYIDEFKIYNYQPTQKQVELIMNQGNSVNF